MKIKILNILSTLFALMFINSGLNKFLHFMPMPEETPESLLIVMSAFMDVGWLLPLAGIVEIVAGILIIAPKFRALGAVMMFPIMIGILLTHLINAPSGLPIAIPLLLINIWIIIDNFHKYLPMIKK